ncbi:MAG: signal peptidase II [Erysipelotrichaceae bacterium]|nr:signal peptidase II [Erysipelotrichaceae bacterium]
MKKNELILLGVLFFVDILSKYLLEHFILLGTSIQLIPSFFYLTTVHNTGAAWGILNGRMEFFFVVTLVVVALIGVMLFDEKTKKPLLRTSLVMILAGTLGNFYDRLVFGYVRDFLDFYIFGYNYPVFNFADCFLVIGFFLLAYFILTSDEE